jgi:hypothetical protein
VFCFLQTCLRCLPQEIVSLCFEYCKMELDPTDLVLYKRISETRSLHGNYQFSLWKQYLVFVTWPPYSEVEAELWIWDLKQDCLVLQRTIPNVKCVRIWQDLLFIHSDKMGEILQLPSLTIIRSFPFEEPYEKLEFFDGQIRFMSCGRQELIKMELSGETISSALSMGWSVKLLPNDIYVTYKTAVCDLYYDVIYNIIVVKNGNRREWILPTSICAIYRIVNLQYPRVAVVLREYKKPSPWRCGTIWFQIWDLSEQIILFRDRTYADKIQVLSDHIFCTIHDKTIQFRDLETGVILTSRKCSKRVLSVSAAEGRLALLFHDGSIEIWKSVFDPKCRLQRVHMLLS